MRIFVGIVYNATALYGVDVTSTRYQGKKHQNVDQQKRKYGDNVGNCHTKYSQTPV